MKHKSITHSVMALALTLIAALVSFSAWAQNTEQTQVTLSGNATDGYSINMPALNKATSVATADVLTLDSPCTFNIYGDKGKGVNYSGYYDGFLLITVPSDYAIRLTGTWVNSGAWDNLTIYDGANDSYSTPYRYFYSSSSETVINIGDNISSSNTYLIKFHAGSSITEWDHVDMNLSATVAPKTDLSLAVIDMQALYGYDNGNPVTIDDYSVSLFGTTLTKGVHYTATIDGQNSTTASTLGTHTLTISAIDGSGYTGSQSFEFELGVMTWSFLQEQFDAGRNVKLANDVTATSSDSYLNVAGSKTIILDLNGHTIDRNMSTASYSGQVFQVAGNLTVCDNSTGQTGVITGGKSTSDGGAFLVTGNLTLQGGTITGNEAQNGGGIYFTSSSYYSNVNLEGGNIVNNIATEKGGGIYYDGIRNTLHMKGSPVIKDNTVNGSQNNIFLAAREINWGNGTAEVLSNVCVITLNGPLTPNTTAGAQIGITAEVSGPQTVVMGWELMKDGDDFYDPIDLFFTDRTPGYTFDYVDYSTYWESDARVRIIGKSHKVTISYAGNGTGEVTPSAPYGTVDNNGKLNVPFEDEVTLNFTFDETNTHIESVSVMDSFNNSYEVRQTETKTYAFTMPNVHVTVTATFATGAAEMNWYDIQHAFDAGQNVTLTNDVTAPAGAPRLEVYAYNYASQTWGKNIELDLNGHILSRGLSSPTEDGQVIRIHGATLTLKDSNPTATHSGTSLTGGILTGGYSGTGKYDGNGGGIFVEELNESNPSILIMEGGAIAGNKTTYEGAGVRVQGFSNSSNANRYAAFEMRGGIITDNECTGDSGVGGGVSIRASWSGAKSYFKMTGGTISNNRANTAGGLETTSSATVNIDGNDVPTVSISGGSIINNTATDKAGGIFAHNIIELSGNPDISGNTCGGSDSNIFLDRYSDGGWQPATIKVVGNLTNTTPFGVTVSDETKPTDTNIRMITTNLGNYGSLSNFTSEQGYVMRLEGGEVAFVNTVIPTLTLHSVEVLGETKYICSFYNTAVAFQLSEGAKAYTVHIDGDDAVFYRIGNDSDIIPEDCPVIIISDTSTATLTPATFTGTKDANNALRATPSKKYGGDLWQGDLRPYGLYCKDGNIAFQRLDDSSQFEAGTVYILK